MSRKRKQQMVRVAVADLAIVKAIAAKRLWTNTTTTAVALRRLARDLGIRCEGPFMDDIPHIGPGKNAREEPQR